MTTEVLRLKCQDLNLITTGKNAELAQRLFDKYHPIVPNPPILVDIGDEEDQLTGTDDTIRYGDDGAEDPLFPNDNNQEQRDELRERLPEERTEEDEQEAGTEHEIRISKTKFLEMIQTVVENSLQGWNEEHQLMDAQVKALRSKLEVMDRHQRDANPRTTSAGNSNSATRPATANQNTANNQNNNTRSTADPSTSRAHTGNQQSTSTNANGACTTTQGKFVHFDSPVNPNTNNSRRSRNPFRVAALDAKVIAAIENGDYVDFDKVKKKKLDEKSKEQSATGMAIKIKEHYTEEGTTLSLNKAKKDMINSFT